MIVCSGVYVVLEGKELEESETLKNGGVDDWCVVHTVEKFRDGGVGRKKNQSMQGKATGVQPRELDQGQGHMHKMIKPGCGWGLYEGLVVGLSDMKK